MQVLRKICKSCADMFDNNKYTILAIILLAAVGLSLWSSYQTRQYADTKADIATLKKTNCNLRHFLLSSGAFRARTAKAHSRAAEKLEGVARAREERLAASDYKAANQSYKFADYFANSSCRVPKKKPAIPRGS